MISVRHINLKRRLANENGFVMIIAIIVLFVLITLTTAAVAVSVSGSTSTTHDGNSKAALAAAEAGLQMAAYRLNQIPVKEENCIEEGSTAEATPEASGYCKAVSKPLGNNAEFQYQTSQALPLPSKTEAKCAGTTVKAIPGTVQRCITSKGKANGVSQRLQTLIAYAAAVESLFSIKGILGLEEVLVSGNVKATGIVASNKKIIGEGSANFEQGFELCPGGEFKPKAGSERNASGVKIHGVGGTTAEPEYEKARSASECPLAAKISSFPGAHATPTDNEDIRISNGEDPNTGEAKGLKYSASNYELEVGANVKLTLKGSKYYFCRVALTSSGELKIPAGGKVEIFIDSHADNSACPKEPKEVAKSKITTEFAIAGSAKIENLGGPSALLIEMAGEGPINIGASGSLAASIFAPEAEVVLSGAGALTGAITANKVHLTAGSFLYSEESGKLTVSNEGASGYSRQAWDQCTSSGTTPEAGC